MNFDWNNYTQLANYLEANELEGIDEETRIRNTISRLFYHAFHCLENWAIASLRYQSTDLGTHRALKEHLKKCKHKDKARLYDDLKDIRAICDYDNNSIEDLTLLLRQAKSIYSDLIGPIKSYSVLNTPKSK